MIMDIKELREKVAMWQRVEDNGGSPTSRGKLLAAKKELAEAKAEVKPIKKAKKAKKVKKVEEVVEEIAADEEE